MPNPNSNPNSGFWKRTGIVTGSGTEQGSDESTEMWMPHCGHPLTALDHTGEWIRKRKRFGSGWLLYDSGGKAVHFARFGLDWLHGGQPQPDK